MSTCSFEGETEPVSLEQIHANNLFITQSRYRDVFRGRSNAVYLKKEFALGGGQWDSRVIRAVNHSGVRGAILITGDSDIELTFWQFLKLRLAGGYSEVWATHVPRRYGAKHRPIPLGLPYDNYYGGAVSEVKGISEAFSITGDISLLREAFLSVSLPSAENLRIFGAFETRNSSDRPELKRVIESSSLGVWKSFTVDRAGRSAYLASMRSAGVVPCPRGRGLDTYRLWEALYMGALPVVRRAPKAYKKLLEGLPVLFVDSWQKLEDQAWLVSEYRQFLTSRKDYSRASLDRIVSCIGVDNAAEPGIPGREP